MGTGAGWGDGRIRHAPRSTHTRIKREKSLTGGRTQEISRLIGRSLRAAVDLKLLGEKQIIVDCDVLNADGGTSHGVCHGRICRVGFSFKKLTDVSEIRANPLVNYVSCDRAWFA